MTVQILKLAVLPVIPAAEAGTAISVTSEDGIRTISIDYSQVQQIPLPDILTDAFVLMWNASTGIYNLVPLSSIPSTKLENVTTASVNIALDTSAALIRRVAPTATTINLPSIADHVAHQLAIADLSTGIVEHTITLTPSGAEKIMGASSWQLVSTAASKAYCTLQKASDGWFFA